MNFKTQVSRFKRSNNGIKSLDSKVVICRFEDLEIYALEIQTFGNWKNLKLEN